MHLKALEMRGFKSFPDKTRLDFEKGITAIVGPNGSGKSNISDAVRWVLGEMSAKAMRGQKMEDVIFSGTAKRQQTGFCEVSLILDNRDGALPDDHEEVKITRKYFRSGDSEYKINDKTSRLKDIYELFLNTGIGREGYSVIGQGKIGEVISQKSDERRHIFEEAAGISKFRYRKNDAEKKLEETEANLVRLRDIVSEIEGRLEPLEKASENAKKYLVLADRKKELEVGLWVDRVAKAAAEAEDFESRTEKAREQYEAKQREADEAEEHWNALSDERMAKNSETELLRENISALETKKNDLAAKTALSENDIRHFTDRLSALDTEKKLLSEGEKARLSAQRDENRALLEKAEAALLAANEDEKAKDEALAAHQRALDAAENEISLSEEDIRAREEALIANRISSSAAENDEKSAADRRAFIEEETKKAGEEEEKAREYLAAATERKKAAEEERKELNESLAEEEKNLADYAREHEELMRQKNEIAASYVAAKERKETLERMERLLEGFPGSVKAVMNANLSGICGPVSSLITVSGEYVTAIETALGAAVTNIVVENEDSAKGAIRYLKEHGAGRATFLPLTSIRAGILDEPGIGREKGFVGIGSKLIHCDKKYDIVAEYLLGRTVVADNIDNASAIARKYRFRYRIVTLDGQLINAGGSYTGGSAANRTGALSRGADIEALAEKIEGCLREAKKITDRMKELSEARAESQQFVDSIQNDLESCVSQIYRCEGDIRQHTEHIETCRKRAEHAREQLSGDSLGGKERLRELSAEREKLTAEQDEAKKKLSDQKENYERLADEFDAAQKAKTDAQMRLYAAGKDAENAKSALSSVTARLAETDEKLDAIRREKEELEKRLCDIREALEHGSEDSEKLDGEIALEREKFDACRERLLLLEKQTNDLRVRQNDIARDKEVYFRELTRCESALEERRKEYDTLTAKLWEEYELTYSDAAALHYPPPTRESNAELASVRAKIRALGSVNVGAVEEYKETKERYEFMTGQINDLESSGKSLENVIRRLESDMKKLFCEAVVKINEQFGMVFAELFGGGSASIVISDEENVLESGIEINVQPPGKMVKSISLLSGGEQAFTAIALYFAILNVNPAPFYIFDEIEAALDDVNVVRFGEYLRRHSKETQFIVITHRRGSMEAADRLYGVTMQEKGVSSFLKVDVDEVEKKTGLKL